MTKLPNLTMADSIRALNLIAGYDAYMGYVDGLWPDVNDIRKMFPGLPVPGLTVIGGHTVADGCDIEKGDLDPVSGAAWTKWRLEQGQERPIVYASVSPMSDVLSELESIGVDRSEVRLLSAHYGAGQHICGPDTCDLISIGMDGTQWTSTASGRLHSYIDASWLLPDFFGTPTWEDQLVAQITTVKKGSTGQPVRNWQGVLVGYGHNLGTSGQFHDGIDGTFGDITYSRTTEFQKAHGLKPDGVVGPLTWTAALA